MIKSKKVATVFALIAPGCGQFYNGQLVKGVIVWLLCPLVIPWLYGIWDARSVADQANKDVNTNRPVVFKALSFYLILPVLSAPMLLFFLSANGGFGYVLTDFKLLFMVLAAPFFIWALLFLYQSCSLVSNFSLIKSLLMFTAVIPLYGVASFFYQVVQVLLASAHADPESKGELIMVGISEATNIGVASVVLSIIAVTSVSYLLAFRDLLAYEA